MKKLKYILSAFAVTVVFNSTAFDQGRSVNAIIKDYNESFKKWIVYKAIHNNSYNYTVINHISDDIYFETQLTVIKGKITKRDCRYYKEDILDKNSPKIFLKSWHETTAKLGSHNKEGAALYTIDDIYKKANDVWFKVNPGTNQLYFESNNNGLVSSVGYIQTSGCKDDCFVGVTIKLIAAL